MNTQNLNANVVESDTDANLDVIAVLESIADDLEPLLEKAVHGETVVYVSTDSINHVHGIIIGEHELSAIKALSGINAEEQWEQDIVLTHACVHLSEGMPHLVIGSIADLANRVDGDACEAIEAIQVCQDSPIAYAVSSVTGKPIFAVKKAVDEKDGDGNDEGWEDDTAIQVAKPLKKGESIDDEDADDDDEGYDEDNALPMSIGEVLVYKEVLGTMCLGWNNIKVVPIHSQLSKAIRLEYTDYTDFSLAYADKHYMFVSDLASSITLHKVTSFNVHEMYLVNTIIKESLDPVVFCLSYTSGHYDGVTMTVPESEIGSDASYEMFYHGDDTFIKVDNFAPVIPMTLDPKTLKNYTRNSVVFKVIGETPKFFQPELVDNITDKVTPIYAKGAVDSSTGVDGLVVYKDWFAQNLEHGNILRYKIDRACDNAAVLNILGDNYNVLNVLDSFNHFIEEGTWTFPSNLRFVVLRCQQLNLYQLVGKLVASDIMVADDGEGNLLNDVASTHNVLPTHEGVYSIVEGTDAILLVDDSGKVYGMFTSFAGTVDEDDNCYVPTSGINTVWYGGDTIVAECVEELQELANVNYVPRAWTNDNDEGKETLQATLLSTECGRAVLRSLHDAGKIVLNVDYEIDTRTPGYESDDHFLIISDVLEDSIVTTSTNFDNANVYLVYLLYPNDGNAEYVCIYKGNVLHAAAISENINGLQDFVHSITHSLALPLNDYNI